MRVKLQLLIKFTKIELKQKSKRMKENFAVFCLLELKCNAVVYKNLNIVKMIHFFTAFFQHFIMTVIFFYVLLIDCIVVFNKVMSKKTIIKVH